MAEPIEQPYEYKPPVYERELVRFIPSPMMTQYHEGLQRKYEEDRRDWRKLHPDRDYKSLTTKEDEHAESKEDCSMEQNKEDRKNSEAEIRNDEKDREAYLESQKRKAEEIESQACQGESER